MNAEPTRTSAGTRSRWWTAVAAFVAGLAIGAVAVGLFPSETSNAPATTRLTGRPLTAAPLPSIDKHDRGSGQRRLVRVINEAQQVYVIISGVGEATTDVDLRRLDEMVRQLQPIEPLLQRDLQACEVNTTGSASPIPTTTPTR